MRRFGILLLVSQLAVVPKCFQFAVIPLPVDHEKSLNLAIGIGNNLLVKPFFEQVQSLG